MPKTNIGKEKRDYLKELVNGRREAMRLSVSALAPRVNMHRQTLANKLASPSDYWTIGELKQFCRALDIPIEEARQNIKF